MDEIELKKIYNELLRQEKQAEIFLDNTDIPIKQKERWIPHYQELIQALNEVLGYMESYTDKEVLEGFIVEK